MNKLIDILWFVDDFCNKFLPLWEAELIANDHLRLPMKYNATGIAPIHTPSSRGTRFFEYGYSYTEDQPPYKYNVTREQQPYPVWKNVQEFHNPTNQLDHLDVTYNRNNRGW